MFFFFGRVHFGTLCTLNFGTIAREKKRKCSNEHKITILNINAGQKNWSVAEKTNQTKIFMKLKIKTAFLCLIIKYFFSLILTFGFILIKCAIAVKKMYLNEEERGNI